MSRSSVPGLSPRSSRNLTPRSLERLQRVVLASSEVQGAHEQRPATLSIGLGLDELLGGADQLVRVDVIVELFGDLKLLQVFAQCAEPGGRCSSGRPLVDVEERRSSPQRQALTARQPNVFEPGGVDGDIRSESVSGSDRVDEACGEHRAQLRDPVANRLLSARRRCDGPQSIDEFVDAAQPVRVDGQRREQCPVQPRRHHDRLLFDHAVDGTEHPQPHPGTLTLTRTGRG